MSLGTAKLDYFCLPFQPRAFFSTLQNGVYKSDLVLLWQWKDSTLITSYQEKYVRWLISQRWLINPFRNFCSSRCSNNKKKNAVPSVWLHISKYAVGLPVPTKRSSWRTGKSQGGTCQISHGAGWKRAVSANLWARYLSWRVVNFFSRSSNDADEVLSICVFVLNSNLYAKYKLVFELTVSKKLNEIQHFTNLEKLWIPIQTTY